jgi:NADH-quinone oxidoreductase subunit G
LRSLAAFIAVQTGSTCGTLSEGPNSAGAQLAGLLPHRAAGGRPRKIPGRNAAEMLAGNLDVALLVNLEPEADIAAVENAVGALASNGFVIAMTPFVSPGLEETADLLLPVGTFAETSGTYVNVAGTWQSFGGVANPVGEARPGWKVLRVLGNLLEIKDFDYASSEDVYRECREQLGPVEATGITAESEAFPVPEGADAPEREIDIPLYAVDAVVRRARALQLTPDAQRTTGAAQKARGEAA